MHKLLKISKHTFGMGDRFAHQGLAQLRAIMLAREAGYPVSPVWNKSNREHTIVHSQPDDLRAEADAAVAALGWQDDYYVDADHIGLQTVDRFLASSNFFTLDVADFTGKPADAASLSAFADSMAAYLGELAIPGIAPALVLTADAVGAAAAKFLLAMQEAGRIYRYLAEHKGADNFVTEVSVDETDSPQTPVELLLILAMLAREGVPVQTIAPKFTGRFNKGVDYVGNLAQFEREFDEDLSVIAYAIGEFGLPASLKLSIHSGSDKFSLYPIINRLVKQHAAGLHVKTAGTTWLEEVIGLAEAGGEGLALAKAVYAGACARFDELTGPYATVIDIDRAQLPDPDAVAGWSSDQFAAALRHEANCAEYNRHFRQLIHVGFKVAAELGSRYTDALVANADIIARNVTDNLFERHLTPLYSCNTVS
ncbi:MAG: tagaturonate epimerase family protein [Verrucomicrobia bacterium]|nr:tagaturonate epimerase family protein [Verrucomicrobiota bacterium]